MTEPQVPVLEPVTGTVLEPKLATDDGGDWQSAPDSVIPARSRPHRGSARLKWLLVGLDAFAIVLSWAPVAFTQQPAFARARPSGAFAIAVVLATVVCLFVASLKRLYRSRVASIKELERSLLVWIALTSAVVGDVVLRHCHVYLATGVLAAHATLAFVLLAGERSLYRSWLRAQRRIGRFARPTIIVGSSEEARYWARLFHEHPELGIAVKGVVDDEPFDSGGTFAPWLGTPSRIVEIAASVGATSVFVMSTAFTVPRLRHVVRDLMRADLHVQVSLGLLGLAHGRLTVTPVSHESILYLERRGLSSRALALKRALDLVLSLVGLVIAAPVIAIFALLVHRADGGPAFFRQERVGHNGKPFVLYKLRTMTPDAEERKHELASANLRQGPLFKATGDPRVTTLGRILRLTSIDELPQLLNVIKGEMSLVGPRPALFEEVAQFEPELLTRHEVMPGITGLWQVEGRDDSSFDSYQRLDLYYVENWSLLLDLSILTSTLASIVGRSLRAISRARSGVRYTG